MTDVTLLGHSAARLVKNDQALVIDPGVFSDLSGMADADAVLVTHGHADHVSAAALVGAAAPVWAPQDVVAQLTEAGVPVDRLHAVEPGDTFTAAGFEVTVIGGVHAEIYPALPPARNNGYVIDGTIAHPGDSLATADAPEAVALVLLPVAAPWLKLEHAIDYARNHPNAAVIPIHDGILSDPGKQLTDGILGAVLGATYTRPAPREAITV